MGWARRWGVVGGGMTVGVLAIVQSGVALGAWSWSDVRSIPTAAFRDDYKPTCINNAEVPAATVNGCIIPRGVN